MTLFRSTTHQEVWQDRWCHTCFQPDEAARRLHGKPTVCPIWERAIRTGRKPVQWDRVRSDEMVKAIRCNEYTEQPPVARKPRAQVDEPPMFELETHEVNYVPVDGWPDAPRKPGTDHA